MRIFLKRNSWLSSVFQRGTVTLSDCSAPHFLPTVITGALWPGSGELLQRGGLHLEGEIDWVERRLAGGILKYRPRREGSSFSDLSAASFWFVSAMRNSEI